jgi:cytochrome c oxidase subunit 3
MLAMTFALAAIGMLFIGLTSAYVVRQGLSEDWKSIPMPRVLWANTAALLLSSFTIERARLALRGGDRRGSVTWLGLTLGLGVLFLSGQLVAWRLLASHGFYLSTNPHSSFFYVFTGLHGIHLAGGLLAVAWTTLLTWGRPSTFSLAGSSTLSTVRASHWVESTALYWHSMDGLWVLLMMLLFVWG